MRSTEIRDAMFKRGLISCKVCHSQIPRKNVSFKDDEARKRLCVQVRCSNPSCRIFGQSSEFYVPTDQFVL